MKFNKITKINRLNKTNINLYNKSHVFKHQSNIYCIQNRMMVHNIYHVVFKIGYIRQKPLSLKSRIRDHKSDNLIEEEQYAAQKYVINKNDDNHVNSKDTTILHTVKRFK